MIPHYKYLFLALAILASMTVAPIAVRAAEISFVTEPAAPAAQQPLSIQVRLSTGEQILNAVQGSVLLPDTLPVVLVDTIDSALTLWPVVAQYNPVTHTVDFTGGVPGGLPANQNVLLFTIKVSGAAAGSYSVDVPTIVGYLNDGEGTAVDIQHRAQIILISASGVPLLQICGGILIVLLAIGVAWYLRRRRLLRT